MRAALTIAMLTAILALASSCTDTGAAHSEERRPYGPEAAAAPRTIEVRNACPEAVVIAVSPTEPVAATPTQVLSSTKVEALTVAPGDRVWLRHSGRWGADLSVAPIEAVEVAFQCNRIHEREGGR